MSLIAEKPNDRLVERCSLDHLETDLIQELGLRLGCLWGYDQFIENAAGRPELQDYWREAKCQEQMLIEQLKRRIERRVLAIRL